MFSFEENRRMGGGVYHHDLFVCLFVFLLSGTWTSTAIGPLIDCQGSRMIRANQM